MKNDTELLLKSQDADIAKEYYKCLENHYNYVSLEKIYLKFLVYSGHNNVEYKPQYFNHDDVMSLLNKCKDELYKKCTEESLLGIERIKK